MQDIHDPETFIDPKKEDILLSDVKEADLQTSIAQASEIDFLSVSSGAPSWPISGIIFGPNQRPFVNLVVARKNRQVNVFFLVDTGSPNTHISMRTMEGLGLSDPVPETITGTIQGLPMSAISLSPLNSHYSDLNVLGTNFLVVARVKMIIDYYSLSVRLEQQVS